MSLSAERVVGALEPFWRSGTKRLVVVVTTEGDVDQLIATGIDPDIADEHSFVFEASFASPLLWDFLAAVMVGDFEIEQNGNPMIVRFPQRINDPSLGNFATSGSPQPGDRGVISVLPLVSPDGPVPTAVVVPDPNPPGGGPKVRLLVVARVVAAATDAAGEQVAATSGAAAA